MGNNATKSDTCFICLNEVNDDIHHFDESELKNMACDCYKHKRVHSKCFNEYLKKNTECTEWMSVVLSKRFAENNKKCAVCRTSVLNNITPLIEASQKGQTDTVKILLEKGTDLNAKNINNWTALMFATEKGHTDIKFFYSLYNNISNVSLCNIFTDIQLMLQ